MMNMVDIRKLNLLYKLLLSFGIVLFVLLFKSVWYNLLLILILGALVRFQKIKVFRFRSLAAGLSVLLSIIFIFKALTGYGRILLHISENLNITGGGLLQGLLTVEQFLVVFLLMGVSLYSASREELFYYFRKIPSRDKTGMHPGLRIGRIGLFVMYLLPALFSRGKEIRGQIRRERQRQQSLGEKFRALTRRLGDFVVEFIREAESVYPDFIGRTEAINYRPISVLNLRHLIILILVAGVHSLLILKWAV